MERGSIFVVIPCYNEAAAIGPTVAEVVSHGYSVVAVDDGSTDASWDIICSFNTIHCLRHPVNLGQGAALQTGVTHALRSGAQIIVHFDADGQHGAEQIDTLIDPILKQEADIVLGCRFFRKSDRDLIPPLKALILRAGIIISWLSTGIWLHDTHNGFRTLSRAAASKVYLKEPGFAHATEILDQIRRGGFRYIERPTTIRYSEYSLRKGQGVLNSFNILIDLCLRKLFK
jgi:glycosyltransferase involved in cell wall biosynthesis